MPYPSQINLTRTVELARSLIEQDGYESVSLSQLATALGVKAPSLYKHFASKADLIRAVNELTMSDLIAALQDSAPADSDPPLMSMARVYRQFALAHPRTYMLAHNSTDEAARIDPQIAESLALPIQAAFAKNVGQEKSLEALRGLWALLHGFTSLEINGQFRREGSVDEAFDSAIRAYLAGWQP